MKKLTGFSKTALIYGFLIWLIPFIIAILIYPLRTSNRPLFESIMPLAMVICVASFSVSYLKKFDKVKLGEGIILGLLWLFQSVLFDFFFFIRGPFKMAVWEYVSDIGLSYLIIPAITIGFAYLLSKKIP